MKLPVQALTLLGLSVFSSVSAEVVKPANYPKEIISRLKVEIRKSFSGSTFKAENKKNEEEKIEEILKGAFGGALSNFNGDDPANEFQVHVTDGDGAARKSYSFIFDQNNGKWSLIAKLEGIFPVGKVPGECGWWDLVTQEHPNGGPVGHTLMRTYRYTNGEYVQISEEIESGG